METVKERMKMETTNNSAQDEQIKNLENKLGEVPQPEEKADDYNASKDELVIHVTTDYDKFSFIPGNREIQERLVIDKMERLKKSNFLSDLPIVVNKEMGILEGQHRFLAAKRLGLPIYYKISKHMTINDVADINAGVNKWKLEAFLDSHIKRGNKEYIRVKHFLDQINKDGQVINLYAAIGLLNGGTAQPSSQLIKDFENGLFKIKDLEHAKHVIKLMKDYEEHVPNVSKTRAFLNAISKLIRSDIYNHKRMIEKIQQKPDMLTKHSDVKGVIENLEQVFNYKSRGEWISFKRL